MNEATPPEPSAAFITRCTEELARQTKQAHGWPNPLRLPQPTTEPQRVALKIWLAELQRQTGVPVRVEYQK